MVGLYHAWIAILYLYYIYHLYCCIQSHHPYVFLCPLNKTTNLCLRYYTFHLARIKLISKNSTILLSSSILCLPISLVCTEQNELPACYYYVWACHYTILCNLLTIEMLVVNSNLSKIPPTSVHCTQITIFQLFALRRMAT